MKLNEEGKIVINIADIGRIKSFAMNKFKNRKGFGNLNSSEIQALLIVEALYDFLKSEGVEPSFEVKIDL